MSTTITAKIFYSDGTSKMATVPVEANLTSGHTEINLSQFGALPETMGPDTYQFNNCTNAFEFGSFRYAPSFDINATRFYGYDDGTYSAAVDVTGLYYNQFNMVGEIWYPREGVKSDSMAYMYYKCCSLTDEPAIPDYIKNCRGVFDGADAFAAHTENGHLTGEFCIPPQLTDGAAMYHCQPILSSDITIPPTVVYSQGMFNGCWNLTGDAVVSSISTATSAMYTACNKLATTDPPVPPLVKDIEDMYRGCWNCVNGVIPENVEKCHQTFFNTSVNNIAVYSNKIENSNKLVPLQKTRSDCHVWLYGPDPLDPFNGHCEVTNQYIWSMGPSDMTGVESTGISWTLLEAKNLYYWSHPTYGNLIVHYGPL